MEFSSYQPPNCQVNNVANFQQNVIWLHEAFDNNKVNKCLFFVESEVFINSDFLCLFAFSPMSSETEIEIIYYFLLITIKIRNITKDSMIIKFI
jgi:hypothetical protein